MDINERIGKGFDSLDDFLNVFDRQKLEASVSIAGGRRIKVSGFGGETSLKKIMECYDKVLSKFGDSEINRTALGQTTKARVSRFLTKLGDIAKQADEKAQEHVFARFRGHNTIGKDEIGQKKLDLLGKIPKDTQVKESPHPKEVAPSNQELKHHYKPKMVRSKSAPISNHIKQAESEVKPTRSGRLPPPLPKAEPEVKPTRSGKLPPPLPKAESEVKPTRSGKLPPPLPIAESEVKPTRSGRLPPPLPKK